MRFYQRLLMPGLMLASVLGLSACGDYANSVSGDVTMPKSNGPNPQNLPNPNTVPKPTPPQGYPVSLSPVTIQEVFADPIGVNTGSQYVELFNSSAFEADIGGWTLTDGTDSHTFGFGFKVPAGGRVVVFIGQSGVDTNTQQFAPSFRELSTVQGSLVLLRAGVDLVDFVQWGSGNNAFESTADSVNEWVSGDFVVNPNEGTAVHYDGSASNSTAWSNGNPTPGN
jgi:hypothetical protein